MDLKVAVVVMVAEEMATTTHVVIKGVARMVH